MIATSTIAYMSAAIELASLVKTFRDVVNVKYMFVSNAALLTFDALVNLQFRVF